jgi:DDE superfamily endonuclease
MSTPDVVRTISVDRQERLREVSRRIFAQLPRADQRRWAEVYLTGLLTTQGRKSIRNIANASVDIEHPAAMQALQQFVNQSPWDWHVIRQSLAHEVTLQLRPRAWVFQNVILPKRGDHSVGVSRRFVASAGRTINCQLGIGVFLSGERRSVPVDWRLVLDGAWLQDPARRQRTKVPADVANQTSLSAHVLDMTDTLTGTWGLPPAPVVADVKGSATGARELARALSERQQEFLLEISGVTDVTENAQFSTMRSGVTMGLPHSRQGRSLTAQQCLARAAADRPHLIALGGGDRGRPYNLRLVSRLVGLPDSNETYRLFTTYRSPACPRENKVWLTNMLDRRMDKAIELISHRVRAERDLECLEEGFGIRDFEGRSYPGWHHHMTLVSAAYAFDALDREPGKKAVLQHTG